MHFSRTAAVRESIFALQQVGADSSAPDGPETRRIPCPPQPCAIPAADRSQIFTQAAASGKSLLARFFDAMVEARMRQATRELAMHRHLLPENSPERPARLSRATAAWCAKGASVVLTLLIALIPELAEISGAGLISRARRARA